MTDPVILLGTQSNGETLPVQVDATGRLVAEGLEGPEGPPGPDGPPGPPGPGMPEGTGTEGQIIQVVQGTPTWVTNDAVPPYVNKGAVLLNNFYTEGGNCGMFDSQGNQPDPVPNSFDEYAKAQPFWETPNKNAPAGYAFKTSKVLVASFDITGPLSYVFILRGAVNIYNNGGDTTFDVTATATNSYLTPVVTTVPVTIPSKSIQCKTVEFMWLLGRPDLGTTDVRMEIGSGYFAASQTWTTYQKWSVMDQGEAAFHRQAVITDEIEEVRTALRLQQSEVDPTTDID